MRGLQVIPVIWVILLASGYIWTKWRKSFLVTGKMNSFNGRKIVQLAQCVQPVKIDIGKPFDKSITIDKRNLTVTNFIGQSIRIDTYNLYWS